MSKDTQVQRGLDVLDTYDARYSVEDRDTVEIATDLLTDLFHGLNESQGLAYSNPALITTVVLTALQHFNEDLGN